MSPVNREALRIEPVRLGDESMALEWLSAPAPAKGPIEGLWAAYRGERMVGAMRAQVQPGRTAIVTPPRLAWDESRESAGQLLGRALEALRPADVQVALALLDNDHDADAELLNSTGFQHAAHLLYLASLRRAFPDAPPAEHLEFVPYAPERHQRLRQTIERTYVGSLDCLAMDRVRTLDDVLAGYRAAGAFDPARWLLVRRAGADMGCVLVADDAANNQWELTYLGVVPEARGSGFGLAMTRHVQWLAKNAGRGRMVVAVDAVNAPAIAVYAAAGFVTWDHRSVFLRVL